MRIISGKFKGKKLEQPLDKNTRPLKDMTKESIFNLLIHSKSVGINFDEINVLDIFSGSGSFGLECISRDAKHVTFVENYNKAVKILKKNIESLNLKNKCQIIEEDIYNLEKKIDFKKKFDLIFADPPYKENKINELLSITIDFKFIKKNSLFVLHRNKKDKDIISKNFKILDTRYYGISKIIFFKLK